MFRKTAILTLLGLVSLAPLASAERLSVLRGEDGSLSSLSVQLQESSQPEQSTMVLASAPSIAPKRNRSVFSDSQSQLMRDLSKTIDVIPGGVRLCLNIHY